jgi:hypothetical protein
VDRFPESDKFSLVFKLREERAERLIRHIGAACAGAVELHNGLGHEKPSLCDDAEATPPAQGAPVTKPRKVSWRPAMFSISNPTFVMK